MKRTISAMVPGAMVSLRKKIQAWRNNKQQRQMPEDLWTEAISLAKEYGVHPVSKNVEVSYTRLKQLVDGDRPLQRPRFVEVSPARSRTGAQIEIQRPDGCRMSVSNADANTVSEMAAVFLGMR